jgi:hypothetical protein
VRDAVDVVARVGAELRPVQVLGVIWGCAQLGLLSSHRNVIT